MGNDMRLIIDGIAAERPEWIPVIQGMLEHLGEKFSGSTVIVVLKSQGIDVPAPNLKYLSSQGVIRKFLDTQQGNRALYEWVDREATQQAIDSLG